MQQAARGGAAHSMSEQHVDTYGKERRGVEEREGEGEQCNERRRHLLLWLV
jgi:hypothetical protein